MTDEERWEGIVKYAHSLTEDETPIESEDDENAPVCVDDYHVKRLRLCFGGPSTYVDFWFSGKDCNADSLLNAYLYTNHIGYGDEGGAKMQEYSYFSDEAEKLYNKYAWFLEDVL